MTIKQNAWRILCVDGDTKTCKKLEPVFTTLIFKNKGVDATHVESQNIVNSFISDVNPELILITIRSGKLDHINHFLRLLESLTHLIDTPIIIISSGNLESLLSQLHLENFNIQAFIDLTHCYEFNTIQLIKSALNNAETLEKYKRKTLELDLSKKQLESSIQLMEETEVLTQSGGWEWDIKNKKLRWTNGVYHIHDLAISSEPSTQEAINNYIKNDRHTIKSAFEKAISDAKPYDLTLCIKTNKNKQKVVRTTGKIRKENNVTTHVYGAISDITKQTKIKQNINNKINFITGILNGISQSVIVLNEQGIILSANPVTVEMFGFSQEELINNSISKLIPKEKRKAHEQYMQSFQHEDLSDVMKVDRKIYVQHKNKTTFPVEVTLNKIKQNNESVYISLIKDITSQVNDEKRIYELAFKDRVTKLSNYQSYEHDFAKALTKSKLLSESICFVQINIDQFFKINFAFGHYFGNKVLCYVSQILTEMANTFNGRIYRISGICFILMFPHKDLITKLFETIKAEILKTLLRKHEIENKQFDLTPIVTVYSSHSATLSKSARKILSLLEFCHKGRNKKQNITLIDTKFLAKINRSLQIENHLRQAIASEKGLFLVYQPQVNIDGKPLSAEALVRWQDDELGMIYPDEFISIAERTGLIIPLTKWIINQCLSDIIQLNAKNINVPISINISANHIVQNNFSADILEPLALYNIDTSQIILELTESAFTDDIQTASMNMAELNKKGIKFSLDDFGTGYSNLGYLNRLPFHELKIDKQFGAVVVNCCHW